jgi:hypothetical protein
MYSCMQLLCQFHLVDVTLPGWRGLGAHSLSGVKWEFGRNNALLVRDRAGMRKVGAPRIRKGWN